MSKSTSQEEDRSSSTSPLSSRNNDALALPYNNSLWNSRHLMYLYIKILMWEDESKLFLEPCLQNTSDIMANMAYRANPIRFSLAQNN